MQDEKQNREILRQASSARNGGKIRWQDTPISETPGAIATDPLRNDGHMQDHWWRKAEPRGVDGKALINLLQKDVDREERRKRNKRPYQHDGKREENRSFGSNRAEDPKYTGDEEEFAEYMPEANENLRKWSEEFSKTYDMNKPGRIAWFGALRNFVAKFPEKTTFGDLSEKNQQAIKTLVQQICESESEAA